MNPMEAVTLGVTALLVVGVLYAAAITGRRVFRDDGRLRLLEMLGARGFRLPDQDSDTAVRASALAVQRCVCCAAHAQCDALLAARDWPRLQRICPNTPYIESISAAAR